VTAAIDRSSDDVGRVAWPVRSRRRRERPRVGIVVANSNTQSLIAGLVFSLYRLLGSTEFAQLVIVDNASTDGSREMLDALQHAGLIHLIVNTRQRYHGPALTQGISWLARRQGEVGADDQLDYIWVLDSDVIVLRKDTLRDALAALQHPQVAALGQRSYDPWHKRQLLEPFSMLLDPAVLWRPPLPPFGEHGSPSAAVQIAAEAIGLHLVSFPFVEQHYILHLGRGTLREIAKRDDVANRYYEWATSHREYHYSGNPAGAQLYQAFAKLLASETGNLTLTPASLVRACTDPALLNLDYALWLANAHETLAPDDRGTRRRPTYPRASEVDAPPRGSRGTAPGTRCK
jgi:Glycosyl transferase family 2